MASTTATALFKCTPSEEVAPSTARITSDSLPTPEGSIRMRSGWYLSSTSFNAVPKSPTREQQIQPEFISVISIPASFKNPPSMPISPNSFSISTTCSPASASFNNFLINVVLPAPKKPDTISIFVILITFLLLCDGLLTNLILTDYKSISYGQIPFFSNFLKFLLYFLQIYHILNQARSLISFGLVI